MTAGVEALVLSPGYRGELTTFCRRMLGSPCEAEDAVQETLLRAWRGSGRFQGRASARSWLYRIATNVCLDALGDAARRPLPVEELPEPRDGGGEPDPAELAIAREHLRLAILAAVGSLPARQRAVLLLRDVLSWRASEVAALLQTTTAGVNSALQRAHAALHSVDLERLADESDEPERELIGRYLAAFAGDDIDLLVSLASAL